MTPDQLIHLCGFFNVIAGLEDFVNVRGR